MRFYKVTFVYPNSNKQFKLNLETEKENSSIRDIELLLKQQLNTNDVHVVSCERIFVDEDEPPTQSTKLAVTINIEGESLEDLIRNLERIRYDIEDGYLSGENRNHHTNYTFEVKEETK